MSDDNVIAFPLGSDELTYGGIDPKVVLGAAAEADLEDVIVVGWSKSGNRLYMASSQGSTAENIALLEVAKHELLHMLLE